MAGKERRDVTLLPKVASCICLLLFTVAATLFTDASKLDDGSYPFNPVAVPCAVEALKLFISTVLLLHSKVKVSDGETAMTFTPLKFARYSLPAFCYFISNNCMLYIIRELGPTTFQITSNLKVLATAVLMRILLGRKLTWLRWKSLILLVLGSVVTQLKSEGSVEGSAIGYSFVAINSFASGAGGVLSEMLLKSNTNDAPESIHWQNMQLYLFGFLFGYGTLLFGSNDDTDELFNGFNIWACATVISLTIAGLLVSFILKYLDNFAKCFVAAFSIIIVASIHATLEVRDFPLKLVVGIILTCLALEQYSLPQE